MQKRELQPHYAQNTGQRMYELIEDLYPICRSITGDGIRDTLKILQRHIPINIQEVPTGTSVFDWEVPKEWNIRDAYIKNSRGEKIIDFQQHNLHILNYSIPTEGKFNLTELKSHLYTLPNQPDLIPYRTSYYQENWGFCMRHDEYTKLEEDTYEVYIDSSLEEGSLTYGEIFIPGESTSEVLISTHICHPSLCNDNLSGIAVSIFLAQSILERKNRLSYRFLFIPGTIGAITWLALNEGKLSNIKYGLVASLLGDAGHFTYKKSRQEVAAIDKIVPYVLSKMGKEHQVINFIPYGYDERQYCSPGINLPMGCLTRSTYGTFPQYHTSADDLNFVQASSLSESLEVYTQIIHILESNRYYQSLNPKCEPQLGRRGLYDLIGGQNDSKQFQMAILWILNYADGEHSLLDISQKSNIDFQLLVKAASTLLQHSLIT